jgi:hypothetical protein
MPDQKEQTYVVMIKGVLTHVPESQLDNTQLSEMYKKTVQYINGMPRTVRSWLAQTIMQQNGVEVFPPGIPQRPMGKKERRKVKTVIVKDQKDAKLKKSDPRNKPL